MATIPASIFVDNAGNTLIYSALGGTPALPPMNQGDTLALSVFYLDRGDSVFPFRGHRYAASSTTVRMRAAGNNHVYATGTSGSEIAPTGGAIVTTVTNGGGGTISKKHVEFGSAPLSGYFKLTFLAPNSCRGNDPAVQGMFTVHGTTAAIPVNATAAQIAAAINALSWQKYDEHGDKVGGLFSPLSFGPAAFVVSNLTATGFDIQYGTSLYAGAGGVLCNPQCYQIVPPGVALPTVDISNVEFAFGWSVSVPLTDSDFANLFLSANAPAYIEVLLTPSGGSQAYAAQYQLESSGGTPGDPPIIPPVGGGPVGIGGVGFGTIFVDGDYAIAMAVDIPRIELPFPQSPADRIYRQRYQQFLTSFSALALDTACPYDGSAVLVGEPTQESTGLAGVIEWDRVWAKVPSTRIEYEIVNYPYQQAYQVSGVWQVIGTTFTRRAKVTYSYFLTSNPAEIALARLPRLLQVNGGLVAFDGAVNLNAGTATIARDDTLERWMGNIWVRTHAEIVI